jgi:hypothetical protein
MDPVADARPHQAAAGNFSSAGAFLHADKLLATVLRHYRCVPLLGRYVDLQQSTHASSESFHSSAFPLY